MPTVNRTASPELVTESVLPVDAPACNVPPDWLVTVRALPVEAFYLATYPIVWFLQESSNQFTRLFGITPAPVGVVTHTEEELRMIVAQAEDTGVIEEAEEEMLYKIFDFAGFAV